MAERYLMVSGTLGFRVGVFLKGEGMPLIAPKEKHRAGLEVFSCSPKMQPAASASSHPSIYSRFCQRLIHLEWKG
jgi:hypothetical protein